MRPPQVETVPQGKPLVASKTFWFNLVSVVYAMLVSQGWHPLPLDPQFQLGMVAVINIALRMVTHEPIKIF